MTVLTPCPPLAEVCGFLGHKKEKRQKIEKDWFAVVLVYVKFRKVCWGDVRFQNNGWYRGPTELVQHFAYRGSLHRRKGATRHIFNMVWLYRSPISVMRRGVIFYFFTVFRIRIRIRIRIHRIRMFVGLPDPDPYPLVRCMDPDPSISKQK